MTESKTQLGLFEQQNLWSFQYRLTQKKYTERYFKNTNQTATAK